MSAQNMGTKANEEQIIYANVLEKFMYIGLGLMLVTFALYVLGIMEPVVPLNEISNYWRQSSHDYLAAVNNNFLHWEHPVTGWSWMRLVGKGDFLNFIPIAILSGVTIICYLSIVPTFFKKGEKAYAIMAIAEALILALAASGLLSAGGH